MNSPTEQSGLGLPGYTLSTRLGAGGYGEVWLAHAPGGLTKAVKFIFGSFHEKRAEHELKALQRIKDLRHPFLLSLERIEVVGGRLVIVTELAESSLKDRFDLCQREGLRGVPRDELLQYLEDAADALDFLSEKHSLQHLDVKPENLLLVAGHVKVADFGLVKDIGSAQASLVGGLTPLYSAPEVFQGSPSARSDQYSLAVLYQEMLTGVLPFAGATAAELTLQHLHEEPELSPLPIADRYVVARALAKDPAHRFANCSEFVQALMAACNGAGDWTDAPQDAGRDTREFASILPERRTAPRPGPVTEFFDEQIEAPRKELSASMLLDWRPPADTPPRCLPPIELATEGFAAQPTLVIGIGGMAAPVLRQIRQRLSRQFGDQPLPAVQLLLLDSDPKAIAQAMQGDAHSALQPDETLALPLRRPQEYREQSARLMRWLSRRWLYNIPKSLRTEGLRPLGRLAFADHARQAVQRIRMSLAQARGAESIAASSERSGLPFGSDSMRVYLVASISGGAGSGMSLDVGYAVRTALEKAGVQNSKIVGVFLHATGRDSRHCDLARVNSYAWLTEYNHFHRPEGEFPGDESCGLPPLDPGKRAFDCAYLLDLGGELDASEFETAAQSVAEYIYLDALTPAQAFFNECRRNNDSSPLGAAALRTFTLRKIPAAPDDALDATAARLAREVALRWSGSDELAQAAPRDTNQLVQGAAELVSHWQLSLEGLALNARELLDGQFGGDPQAFIDGLVQISAEDGQAAGLPELIHVIDCVFAPPKDQPERPCILQRPLEGIMSPLTMKLAGDLTRWVLQKLDDRHERLPGAESAAQWLVDHVARVECDASRLAAALAKQIAASADELRRAAQTAVRSDEGAGQLAAAYFRMRTDHQALFASSLIARRLLAELKSVGDTIAECGRHLKHIAASLPAPAQESHTSDPLSQVVTRSLGQLADAVDERIQIEVLSPNGGLLQTIMGPARGRAQMLVELTKHARRAAEQLATRPEVLQGAFSFDGAGPLRDGDQSTPPAPPKLLRHGGAYRGLAVLPQQAIAASDRLIAEELGPSPSVLTGFGHDVIFCQEGWELPIAPTAVDVIQNRRDYADFAARVLTRSDVAWTPLTTPISAFPVASDDVFAAAMPAMTQVL